MTTTKPGRISRIGNCMGAAKGARQADKRARWPREQILAHQQGQLGQLVAHATRNSPFYRGLYDGVLAPGDVELNALPPVSKAAWMAAFEDVVTDRRLRIDTVEAHLAEVREDVLHLGDYRVLASSGSTGRRGIYVWSTRDWKQLLAIMLRESHARGQDAALPRRRYATVMAPDARHLSHRVASSLDGGLVRALTLSAATPLDELVAALQRFEPDLLRGYPSVISSLAGEQQAGRLGIAPRWVHTSGEVLTPDMAARVRDAWGVVTANDYAMTEVGLAGSTCPEEGNLHLNEDACILEPVDDEGRPVPAGEYGTRVLVTSLLNTAQPVIRMEVSDEIAISPTPCACGRSLQHLVDLRGRNDDILDFAVGDMRTVKIHPVKLHAAFTTMKDVVAYQFVKRPQELEVVLVLTAAVDGQVPQHVAETITATLRDQAITDFPVRVRVADHIVREKGAAKFKLVKIEG